MAANDEKGVAALAKSLQSDRLIKVYIGPKDASANPYLIQQHLLETTSRFFRKAFADGRFKEGDEGCIRFPEDNRSAWEILLFWMMERCMAPFIAQNPMLATRCWILGDRHSIEAFQDEAMLCLLHFCRYETPEIAVIKEAFESAPQKSGLRRLMTEELGYSLCRNMRAYHEIARLDDDDFLEEIRRAIDQHCEAKYAANRFEEDVNYGIASPWRRYMVGKAPSRHWILIENGCREDDEDSA